MPLMRKNTKFQHLWLFYFFADIAAICAAYFITYFFRFHSDLGEQLFSVISRTIGVRDTGVIAGPYEEFYIVSAPRIILIMVCLICFIYALFNLYPGRRFILRRPVAWHIILANMIALVLFYVYFYLRRNVFHPRSYFITVLFFNVLLCVWFRSWMDRLLDFLRASCSLDPYTAIVVGGNRDADYIKSVIDVLHPYGLKIVGRTTFDKNKEFEVLLRETDEMARDTAVDMLIVADNRFSVNEIMRFMELADKLSVSVKVLSDKMNVLHNQAHISVDRVHGLPLVHFDSPWKTSLLLNGSGFISKAVAVLLLVVLSPVLIVAAVLIKLSSRGPILFIQERIGVNREPFMMYKFRTMYDRAEEAQAQLEEFNETNGVFKMRRDPRITPVGRLLRRFSIDELPQLFNVLKGEMRIIGPRPLPKRDFENYYEEWHYSRHNGWPGLTCLWQISGRSDIDFHNMCILDVYYLRNRSWVLDIKIFMQTFWVVLFGRGAY